MVRFTPLIRVILIGVATAISVVVAVQDSLPIWAQAIVVGLSTILAGLGIVPPHIPTITLATKTPPVEAVPQPTTTIAPQPPKSNL